MSISPSPWELGKIKRKCFFTKPLSLAFWQNCVILCNLALLHAFIHPNSTCSFSYRDFSPLIGLLTFYQAVFHGFFLSNFASSSLGNINKRADSKKKSLLTWPISVKWVVYSLLWPLSIFLMVHGLATNCFKSCSLFLSLIPNTC